MSAESAFVRSWVVGRYTVTLSSPLPQPGQARSAVIEWDPEIPLKMTGAEIAEYRAGRDAALAQLAHEMRGSIAVIEL